MRRSRFTEGQILGILKEHDAGRSAAELCRKHGISDQTLYPALFTQVRASGWRGVDLAAGSSC